MNINSAHGAHQTSKTTNDFTQMVGDLRRKADVDRDGSVSTAEFAQFLDRLVEEDSKHAEAPRTASAPEPAQAPAPVRKG